jgi:C4-dicarboxylate-specific signal transduction histidine kinase
MDLAHANRLATMGQLTASIAHEVNQPIGAVRNNAHAALRFLAGDPPDLAEVREALDCVVSETYRAGDIIGGIREQIKKAPPRMEPFDLNEAIEEVIKLVRGELSKQHVSVQTRLTEGLRLVHGDRVQLQQVVLNLIVNAIEAMASTDDDARELVVSTESSAAEGLARRGRRLGTRRRRGRSRADFRVLLHYEARRSGDRPFDLPLHHRRPWRAIVGGRA